MLQNESILSVADNSGAKEILIIRVLGGSKRRYARIGDFVIASVKKAIPNSENVKKKEVVLALVVATKGIFIRKSNDSLVKFSKNFAIILNKESREPVGTRIFIPLVTELNKKEHKKLFSLAKEIF